MASIHDILPKEIVSAIFSYVDDVSTFVNAVLVNKFWNQKFNQLWREYCNKRGWLEDEEFWKANKKNWKFVCFTKQRVFTENGKQHGYGVYSVSKNGQVVSTYEGGWQNGKYYGIGIYKELPDLVMKGHWKKGVLDGFGECKRSGANVSGTYAGEYREGLPQGNGVFTWSNGDVYDGKWFMGNRTGPGKYKYANGDIYDGQHADNIKKGKGEFTYSRYNAKYVGNFEDNKPHGNGVYTWSNGDSYKGSWVQGARKGKGTLKLANGKTFAQVWADRKIHPYLFEEINQFSDDSEELTKNKEE